MHLLSPRPDRCRPTVRLAHAHLPPLRRLLVVAGGLGLLSIGDGFVYLALQDRDGFATQWFPLLYVGTNVAYMSLAIPVGLLADRWGRARVFAGGHVALLGAYVGAGARAGTVATTIATLVLLGAFYAATDGVLAAVVSQLSATSSRATAIGTAQTVVAVARMVATAAFGVLWFAVGRGPAVLTVAAVRTVAVPLALWAVRDLDTGSTGEDATVRQAPQLSGASATAGRTPPRSPARGADEE